MAFPTLSVECAFTTAPGATPTWTDISAYVYRIPALESANRDSELDRDFRAGTCRIVLDNLDRRFEPEFAGSPYYPNVKPMRRLRVRATWNAVTYDLFSGYVERWPVEYRGSDARVEVTATDGFLALQQASLPTSVWEAEVRLDNPRAWWRLGELSGTVAFDSSGNAYDGNYIGGATFNSRTSLLALDDDNGIEFHHGQKATLPEDALPAAYPFTVEAWVNTAERDNQWARPILTTPIERTERVQLRLNSSNDPVAPNRFVFEVYDASVGRSVYSSVSAVPDATYHVVGVAISAADLRIYVNGVDRTVVNVTGSPAIVRGPLQMLGGSSTKPITVDEVAVYPSALSATLVAAHHQAGTTPWAGDRSGERIGHVLDSIGWPSADRQIDVGNSTLQATRLGGKALPYLQQVAATEDGALHMTADGKVRLRERHAMLKAPYTTSQATIGDPDSPDALQYVDLEPSYEIGYVKNVIRRAREGGPVVEVRDAASVTDYFEHADENLSMMVASDSDARNAAEWTLSRTKAPALRFREVVLEPYGQEDGLFPHLLGRVVGDRVTIRRRPPGGGAMLEKQVHIEGIRHEIAENQWRTTWKLSPAPTTTEGDYWVLGTSTLGVSSVLAY